MPCLKDGWRLENHYVDDHPVAFQCLVCFRLSVPWPSWYKVLAKKYMVSKCFKATLKQASLGFTRRLPIQMSTCPQATPLATDRRSLLNTKPYSLFGRLSCAEFDTWNVTSMSSRAHAWPAQVYFVFLTCACPLIIVLLHRAICVLHV